jgi:hypothetical protein
MLHNAVVSPAEFVMQMYSTALLRLLEAMKMNSLNLGLTILLGI